MGYSFSPPERLNCTATPLIFHTFPTKTETSIVGRAVLFSIYKIHVLCYQPCSVLPAMFCVTSHVLCYQSCSVLPVMFCVTSHVLCYQPCSVLPAMFCVTSHVLCYQPCSVLLAMFCVTSHVLCYQPCSVLPALASQLFSLSDLL